MSAQIEYHEQVNLASWLWENHPQLLWTASAGGARVSPGTARKLKMMGCRAGTPDILIFEPRGQYHGLLIELKRPKGPGVTKGVVSDSQREFASMAIGKNYCCKVCYGSEEAKTEIKSYLGVL